MIPDEEFFNGVMGDATALQELQTAIKNRFPDEKIHVSWNPDFVNRIASLSGEERYVEVALGVEEFARMLSDLESGNCTVVQEIDEDLTIPEDVSNVINNVEL